MSQRIYRHGQGYRILRAYLDRAHNHVEHAKATDARQARRPSMDRQRLYVWAAYWDADTLCRQEHGKGLRQVVAEAQGEQRDDLTDAHIETALKQLVKEQCI